MIDEGRGITKQAEKKRQTERNGENLEKDTVIHRMWEGGRQRERSEECNNVIKQLRNGGFSTLRRF